MIIYLHHISICLSLAEGQQRHVNIHRGQVQTPCSDRLLAGLAENRNDKIVYKRCMQGTIRMYKKSNID